MISWEELTSQCMSCTKCGLCETRTNVVFGVGNKEARIMFIGEAPGEQEDLKGEPFVGPAGKLLDDMLSIIDLNRENCYIANIVKCRPPQNRDPSDEERNACIDYVRKQTMLINPQVIVCLGSVAARTIIDPDYRISKSHGKWIDRNDVWITAIYHPSALLRDPSKRPTTFEDLLDIRKRLDKMKRYID